jgi:myo-inositol 2-dehydrogenase/D-chiro-inositol 1-dehydrogenase
MNPDEARGVVEAEARSGRSLVAVGLMRRFDPAHVAMRAQLGPDGIGAPVLFRGIHRNQWRAEHPTGRRTIVASGVHDIDSARWLLGEFESVSVVGAETRGDGDVDVVHIQGRHVGGGISVLEVNGAAGYGYEVSAEVVGVNGAASTRDPDHVTVRLHNQRGTALPANWMPRFADAYRIQMRSWVDTCATGAPYPGATAVDGYRDQVVAELAVQALESGAVVPVPVF